MPEYLAPGVFVEETSFRSKSIEGVSTTTTGFIGPTRYGPVDLEPDVITSLGEFERTYGDRQQLEFTNTSDLTKTSQHNFMWHAARAFFEEGGKRLYISRVFKSINTTGGGDRGFAKAWLPGTTVPTDPNSRKKGILVRARFPGAAGKTRVRLTLRLGPNVLSSEPVPGQPGTTRTTVKSLLDGDLVWLSDLPDSPLSPLSPPDSEPGDFYIARQIDDSTTKEKTWHFEKPLDVAPLASSPLSPSRALATLFADPDPLKSDKVKVVTITVTVFPAGESDLPPVVYSGLAVEPGHKRAGEPDSVFDKFAAKPSNLGEARRLPIVIERGTDDDKDTSITNAIDVLNIFFDEKDHRAQATDASVKDVLVAALNRFVSTDDDRSIDLLLDGGNDGQRPQAADYEGTADDDSPFKTGLKSFEDIEDISIVAAPGSTYGHENNYRTNSATISSHLISHAERMRYRIAVLDSGDQQTISQVRAMRSRVDSKYAAFYYPWVRVLDPVTGQEIHLPPSGFVSGIYARNDIQRAVFKAPANEVVNLAIGFEHLLNKSQQEVLNPEGINCFRFFEGRGFRLWGARTISSDPEWKYVNLRRYFAYLERSIDKGTQWAVFEPNGEQLWGNVRRTIEDFLFNEFQMGALLGDKPDRAYFVRCDRTTMTQNDLDNGRLVCLIGVAPLRPAEFVIIRIGQWTADRKS
jgi:uncharacterized protein